MKISLSFDHRKPRQMEYDAACKKGIFASGNTVVKINDGDALITWGTHRGNATIIRQYRETKRPVLIMDLGYWGRKVYFKVSLNQLHPANILSERFSGTRYENTGGFEIQPWRDHGSFVLLAAMGPKGCTAYGQAHGQWDAMAYKKIKQNTNLPIIWKVKPSDIHPVIPPGVETFTGGKMLSDYPLEDCAAVVTHHGNCSVEAIAKGIPAFCADGAAAQICDFDLSKIGTAKLPENRVQFLHNLAYWQWNKSEIENGQMFTEYQKRGFI